MLNKETFSISVLDHMKSYYTTTWGLRGEEFVAFAPANMWFLTVTPGCNSQDEAFKYFRVHYARFLKLMFGSKPARNALLQPMGYAFLDFAGSRSGHLPRAKLLPHVHALLMIHPLTKARFDAISKKGTVFEGAELFDPNKEGTDYIATYTLKGTVGRNGFRADEDGKEWEVYPRLTSKTDPRFKRTGRIVPYTDEALPFDDEFLAELQRTADDEGFRRSVQVLEAVRSYKRSRKKGQRD